MSNLAHITLCRATLRAISAIVDQARCIQAFILVYVKPVVLGA